MRAMNAMLAAAAFTGAGRLAPNPVTSRYRNRRP